MGSCRYSASPATSSLTLPRVQAQSCIVSLDHLVGLGEELLWDVETQRASGFEIDDQLECGRLLDRHVRRIGTLEDLYRALDDPGPDPTWSYHTDEDYDALVRELLALHP